MAANLNVFKEIIKKISFYANRNFFSNTLFKLGILKNQLRKDKRIDVMGTLSQVKFFLHICTFVLLLVNDFMTASVN